MSTVVPVNVGDVVTALIAQIESHPAVADINPTVERSQGNDDASRCPWVCVYRFGVRYLPRTLGAGAGFRRQEIDLAIAVQHTDATSGEECEDKLEALLQAVMGAILSDPTIAGTVQMLGESIEVSYPDYQMAEDQFMQTALINFTAITAVSIGG